MLTNHSKLIIEGVDKKGEIFRPHNWAERISSVAANYGTDHRLKFSPFVHPEINNGIVCLVVDLALEKADPVMFQYVMSFVETNDLVTHYVYDEVA